MGRKKLINKTGVPQYVIERIARCLLPDIQAYYESEEGQRDYAEWQKQQEEAQAKEKAQRGK